MIETHYGGVRMNSPYLPGARVRTPRGVGVIRWVFRCAPYPWKDMATVKLPRERYALPFYLSELEPLDEQRTPWPVDNLNFRRLTNA